MQSRWAGDYIFVHKSSTDDYRKNKKIGFIVLLKLSWATSKNDAFVFHAQSSLPYLLFFYVCAKIMRSKARIVYDIHDLHEWLPSYRILSRSGFRFFILQMLEHFSFLLHGINKITVSNGLAQLMAGKYNKSLPIVVRNTSGHASLFKPTHRKKNTIVYFGIKEHAPVRVMRKLISSGVDIHLYGRGMTADWLNEVFGQSIERVKVFDDFDPNDLSFLGYYKVLILYPSEKKLNYRYAMPNKLFQAIDHGLSAVVSDCFEEILQTFYWAGDCVYSATDENIECVVAKALEDWTEKSCDAGKKIQTLIYEESRKNYIASVNSFG